MFPRWAKWLALIVSAGTIIVSVHRAANSIETRTHADSTYLSKSDYASQRKDDSSRAENALIEERHILFGLDSSDRCRRKQVSYCR